MKTITERALYQRINRKLAPDGRKLCKVRGFPGGWANPHRVLYQVLEESRWTGLAYDLVGDEIKCRRELEALGRELGALGPGEAVSS